MLRTKQNILYKNHIYLRVFEDPAYIKLSPYNKVYRKTSPFYSIPNASFLYQLNKAEKNRLEIKGLKCFSLDKTRYDHPSVKP